jgi:hypothetical protein
MATSRLDQAGSLTRAWVDASAALPLGWRLEGIVCGSSSLHPADRSDEWIAVAASRGEPSQRLEGRGAFPQQALENLAAALRELPQPGR